MNRLQKIALAAAAMAALASPAFAQSSVVTSTTASTTIVAPLTVTKNTELRFGTVVKPTAANDNVVLINASTGAQSLTGAGTAAFAAGDSGAATFSVGGESGRTFSISTPATVTMVNGGNNLVVTLTKTAAVGTIGQASANFGVGGSFPITSTTASGAYTANFDVTVAYN